MNSDFIGKLYLKQSACPDCPSPEVVSAWFTDLLGTLFPDFSSQKFGTQKEFELHLDQLKLRLEGILTKNPIRSTNKADETAQKFFDLIPSIYKMLEEDVLAIYEGDPAAKSHTEVVRTYPGFIAIASHRIAHALHQLEIALVPRIISEFAHSRTGIDIHPGATIGHYFCIDHGTGIVIGETTEIGDHVKIYQGVTLGGLSVNKEDAQVKRHPTIEDHVVIYAGATILGGKTTVGEHSIIGGNVWLTHSIPAKTKIYYQAQMTNSNSAKDTIIFKGQSA